MDGAAAGFTGSTSFAEVAVLEVEDWAEGVPRDA